MNNNPSCSVVDRGGLSAGVQPPAFPNCDLPQNLYDYLVYVPGTGATVEQFTVVKVYYEHDPLTPVGALSAQFGWGGYPPLAASLCPAQRFFKVCRKKSLHENFPTPSPSACAD